MTNDFLKWLDNLYPMKCHT